MHETGSKDVLRWKRVENTDIAGVILGGIQKIKVRDVRLEEKCDGGAQREHISLSVQLS